LPADFEAFHHFTFNILIFAVMKLCMLLFLESIGTGELLVILLFVLFFFGSKKIPDLARGLGKGMREVKDAMQGIQRDINEGVNLEEEKRMIQDIKKDIDKTKDEL
jgi:sec-independent protein translocase protein TatA